MVMKRPPVMISLSGRVPGRALEPSRSRVDDDGGCGTFRGILIVCLGFPEEGPSPAGCREELQNHPDLGDRKSVV